MVRTPIFLDDDGSVDVFETLAGACLYMEACDVRQGVYRAFDGEGQVLEPGTLGEVVTLTPTGQYAARVLESVVRGFLASARDPQVDQTNTLSDLVDLAAKYARAN